MKDLGIGPLVNFYNRQDKNDVYHKIAGILLQNVTRLSSLTVQEAANICFTSSATISRLAKKAGYEGFNAMKDAARRQEAGYFQENRVLPPEQLIDADTTETYLSTLIHMFMEMNRVLERDKVEKAVNLIAESSSVYYFGSCDIMRRFQQDLFFNGKYVEVYQVFGADTPHLIEWAKNAVAIIENPGYPWFNSDDIILKIKAFGVKVILITCSARPELEEQVDLAIRLPGTKFGRDEVLYHALINIMALEYRKKYMDDWFYK